MNPVFEKAATELGFNDPQELVEFDANHALGGADDSRMRAEILIVDTIARKAKRKDSKGIDRLVKLAMSLPSVRFYEIETEDEALSLFISGKKTKVSIRNIGGVWRVSAPGIRDRVVEWTGYRRSDEIIAEDAAYEVATGWRAAFDKIQKDSR